MAISEQQNRRDRQRRATLQKESEDRLKDLLLNKDGIKRLLAISDAEWLRAVRSSGQE